jgi:type IV pilus assembly protein PilZ
LIVRAPRATRAKEQHPVSERVEQRRYARVPVNLPAAFAVKGTAERREGLCKDISLGGTFIETDSPCGFGAEVVVHVTLPGAHQGLALPGIVRWLRAGGMGIQFGSLGAVETHAITEVGR